MSCDGEVRPERISGTAGMVLIATLATAIRDASADGGQHFAAWSMDFSAQLLNTSPYRGTRRVIDISGTGKLRDELLNGEIFYSLKEAKVLIEQWRKHYNTVRPHSSLGYRPPAPQAVSSFPPPLDQAAPMQ